MVSFPVRGSGWLIWSLQPLHLMEEASAEMSFYHDEPPRHDLGSPTISFLSWYVLSHLCPERLPSFLVLVIEMMTAS